MNGKGSKSRPMSVKRDEYFIRHELSFNSKLSKKERDQLLKELQELNATKTR